jgi:hypothetical protein
MLPVPVRLAAPLLAASALAFSGGAAAAPDHGGAARYFTVLCGFSHRNQDDPIVFPRQRGHSHDHTYFGNTSTDAFSTPASLRASGRSTCRAPGDTAAYWAPTLFVGHRPVEPLGAAVFYVRRTTGTVQPFPSGLRMIAGDAAARAPQSLRVTSWSCGLPGSGESTSIPTCVDRKLGLRLRVTFPDCWDGRRLDSADHRSHMAYSAGGTCPASYPVAVPGITILILYPARGGASAELASGGQFSGHADFVNAWDQRALSELVDRYLNGAVKGALGP